MEPGSGEGEFTGEGVADKECGLLPEESFKERGCGLKSKSSPLLFV